LYIKAVK